uniref:TetR family transcriptional regulator n=1 Tax=uncultured bacterium Contig1491 TaxID=1393439 RepID=W0FPF5_9BACT|nr:TetR family transcriptional regulator [uncultured bacterium Contig1491]
MPNTDDLRYVRTEGAIREAFMSLVAEKPVASVTASELCRKAGISRNAFYLHYASVLTLYTTLVGELVSNIRAESIASAERRSATGRDDELDAAIVATLAKHEGLLRALLPSDDGPLAKCLAEGIEEAFVEAALRYGKHGGSLEHRLRCAYSAWGIVGLAAHWIASTNRPLSEALPHFEELLASAVESSARYLMGNHDRER